MVLPQKLEPRRSIRRIAEHPGDNAPLAGMRQSGRLGPIAHNQYDLGRRAGPQGPEERREVATAPRNGHGYAHRHGGGK